jgi:hypothetical protein
VYYSIALYTSAKDRNDSVHSSDPSAHDFISSSLVFFDLLSTNRHVSSSPKLTYYRNLRYAERFQEPPVQLHPPASFLQANQYNPSPKIDNFSPDLYFSPRSFQI